MDSLASVFVTAQKNNKNAPPINQAKKALRQKT
jgi:hypothetical protein